MSATRKYLRGEDDHLLDGPDGTRLVAEEGGGSIFTSTDSGTTWRQVQVPACFAVACSADGGRWVAAGEGMIASSQSTLPPRLSSFLSDDNLCVSWIAPSTSFVLQQNHGLTSGEWTDVPSPSTLNLTNLHYQVTVSPSAGSRFYRLKQP